jgi:hypothetical protein
MRKSAFQWSPQLALRIVWGIAAVGMLIERAPWAQRNLWSAADGYLGFLTIGLFAVTGGTDTARSRKVLLVVSVAWLAVMVWRLLGTPA